MMSFLKGSEAQRGLYAADGAEALTANHCTNIIKALVLYGTVLMAVVPPSDGTLHWH